MENDITTNREHVEIDMANTVVGWDYQIGVGKQTEAKPGNCPNCGRDHSKDKFIVLTLETPDYKKYQVVIPEGSPMWENILNGFLSEEARTCLARLEVMDL